MSTLTSVARRDERRPKGPTAAMLFPVLLAAASAAHSVVLAGVQVFMPDTAIVGQRSAGAIKVTNANTGADAGFSDTVDFLLVVPACNQVNGSCPAGNEDPKVFTLLPEAIGEGACAGKVLTASVVNPALGIWQISSTTPIVLPSSGSFCHVNFYFRITDQPVHPVNPSSIHVQTYAVGSTRVTAQTGPQFTASTASNIVEVFQGCTFDVDGNGSFDALTDGLLVIRALFGLSGTAATAGAVGTGARRTTWADIRNYLNFTCGMNLP